MSSSRKPAVCRGAELILRQITSQAWEDGYSIRLDAPDFILGGLNQSRRIRPNRLFTADSAHCLPTA
jgi:hypothetical protein